MIWMLCKYVHQCFHEQECINVGGPGSVIVSSCYGQLLPTAYFFLRAAVIFFPVVCGKCDSAGSGQSRQLGTIMCVPGLAWTVPVFCCSSYGPSDHHHHIRKHSIRVISKIETCAIKNSIFLLFFPFKIYLTFLK